MKHILEVDVYLVNHDESVIVFPSGFAGTKMAVAVSEDPSYNISAWYPDENQIKQMQELDKQNRAEMPQNQTEMKSIINEGIIE